MIRGWFTEIPSWRGRDGTRIPEFGMAARTCRSEWVLESASSEVLDGAGITGDSIGVTDIATFGGGRYYSRSNTFYNRNAFNRGGGARGGVSNRGNINRGGGAGGGVSSRSGPTARAFNGNRQAARGYAAPRGQSGARSGAFSGIEKGGQTKSYSARGSASVGGGAARGGGGGAIARWRWRRSAWRRWRASLIKAPLCS